MKLLQRSTDRPKWSLYSTLVSRPGHVHALSPWIHFQWVDGENPQLRSCVFYNWIWRFPAEIHTNSGRIVWKSWICLLMFVVHAVIIWWRSNLSWVCEREWNYILCRKKEKMSPECKWSIWPVRSCWWLQDTGSIKFTSQSPSFQCRNCFIKSHQKDPENLQQSDLVRISFH